MKYQPGATDLWREAVCVSLSIIALSTALVQPANAQADSPQPPNEALGQQVQYQLELQQVEDDKSGYAQRIVQRWELSAKTSDRWDENAKANLYNALMDLPPDNLLAADKATSLDEMMAVLANGPRQNQSLATTSAKKPQSALAKEIAPASLGSLTSDLVYTPVTPCKIVDTRVAGGVMVANVTRAFDVDGTNFSAQGGSATGCGIPYGVPRAVEMTITATQTVGTGGFKAWQWGGTQPTNSVLTFNGAAQSVTTNAPVGVVPGAGADFNLVSSIGAHAVITVVGYYSAPVATALDCITVSSAMTTVQYNVWAYVDAACPTGRTVTGGGYTTPEGSLGRPGIWIDSLPNGNGWRALVDNQTGSDRRVQSFAVCCRVPGR